MNDKEGLEFKLFNLKGKLVHKAHIQEQKSELNFDHLPKGVYLFTIRNGDIELGKGKLLHEYNEYT